MNSPAAAELRDGIFFMISRWSALQGAIDQGFVGRDAVKKSEHLGEDLFNLLTQSEGLVVACDVMDMLDDFMVTLGFDLEDGSTEEIANIMMAMREDCSRGNFDSVKRLKETETRRRNDESVMEVDGTEEEDDTQQSGMEVDEDGFTPVVSRKGKKKRKNKKTID